jgi:predicted RNase H-like HicB family nuclease
LLAPQAARASYGTLPPDELAWRIQGGDLRKGALRILAAVTSLDDPRVVDAQRQYATVPLHAGERIGPGLLRAILAQGGISADELRSALWEDDHMRTYTIVLEPEETGGSMVLVPALAGCFTQGRTIDECRDRAAEAIAVHIAGLEADGEPVPEEFGAPQTLTVTVAA